MHNFGNADLRVGVVDGWDFGLERGTKAYLASHLLLLSTVRALVAAVGRILSVKLQACKMKLL